MGQRRRNTQHAATNFNQRWKHIQERRGCKGKAHKAFNLKNASVTAQKAEMTSVCGKPMRIVSRIQLLSSSRSLMRIFVSSQFGQRLGHYEQCRNRRDTEAWFLIPFALRKRVIYEPRSLSYICILYDTSQESSKPRPPGNQLEDLSVFFCNLHRCGVRKL